MTLTFHDQNANETTSTGTAPHPPIGPTRQTEPQQQGSTPSASQPSASRPNLPITPVVAGLLATLGGAAALIGSTGWADLHPAPIIGGALAIIVGGFVARSQLGGGRGLIPVSMLMLVAVTVAAVASPYLDEGTGDKNVHPSAFSEVESEYSYGIGSMVVDLRDVDFPAGVHTIYIDHGIGSAQVWLPAGVNYEVAGETDIGDIDVFGNTEDGLNNEVEARSNNTSAATVVIDFNVDIGYGRVGQD
jgi:hypothetical protein